MKFDGVKIINSFFISCAAAGIAYLCFDAYYKDELRFCEDYSQLISANKVVDDYYYKPVNKDSLQYDMVEGLFDGLDDRYTYYNSKKETDLACVNDSLLLKSNGIKIGRENNKQMIVTDVAIDSFAERSGMAAGDKIISINDVIVQSNGFYNSLDLLSCKDKKPIELVCEQNGKRYTFSLEKRANFKDEEKEVKDKLYDNGVLYYKFNSFDYHTIPDFEKIIEKYGNEIKGIVIDLRNNGGGDIAESVDLFNEFYGAGSSVRLIYEKSGKEDVFTTSAGVKYDLPVVLLVSNNTLSAAEAFTALFQNTRRGIAVGTVTGGKGSFQHSLPLDDYSQMRVVAGYYYVNDMPNYDGIGITPDVIVEMDPSLIGTDDDIQLKKAIELLS